MTASASDLTLISPTTSLVTEHDPRGLGGLIVLAEGGQQAVPLQEVKVRASIAGDCCRVVIDQRFQNDLDVPLEAIHIFPLSADGAVVEMELRAGAVTVRAECRERQEAERAFEEARKDGHRAGLLTREREDVHTLRVTNLPPRCEVTVHLVVVERLESFDGLFRWRFPTVIAPRFMPGEPTGHAGFGVGPDTTQVPDASRIQPPLLLEGGATLDLEVEIAGSVRTVESSLHAVRVNLPGERGAGVRVAPSARSTLDRDFILAFSMAEETALATRAWTDGLYTLVVIEPPARPLGSQLPRDAVFVIDVSGSMSGVKLEGAKKALSCALHGLNGSDRFKLISFSDALTQFADGFSEYNSSSLKKADTWIAGLHEDGGTVMLPAIEAALRPEEGPERTCTVLLITDGQVGNEDALIAAVKNRRKSARVFTMGIDTAVSESALKRMARVGGGTCQLLTPFDDLEAAVNRLESRFGSPLVEEIKLEGGEPADGRPLTLFAGCPVSALMAGAPELIHIHGRTATGEFATEVQPSRTGFELGPLWARERVAALEDRLSLFPWEEEAVRGEVLRIALQHNIASRYTAFVAVDKSISVHGERKEIVNPVELPMGWDRAFLKDEIRFCTSYDDTPAAPPRGGSLLKRYEQAQTSPPQPEDLAPSRLQAIRDKTPGRVSQAGEGGILDLKTRVQNKLLTELGPSMDVNRTPKVRQTIEELFEGILAEKNIVLSRTEKRRMYEAIVAEIVGPEDPGGSLARSQEADGSFGGDVVRTAAALAALVLLGHTRRKGVCQRVVSKAASWLEGHKQQDEASFALSVLSQGEQGLEPREILAHDRSRLEGLIAAGDEGEILRKAIGLIPSPA